MPTPTAASLRTNKFRSRFACVITFPSLINVIIVRSSWNNIPLLRSWPRKMRFKSHSSALATLWSLIVLPSDSGMATVPILFVCMTWPATVTKSILLAWVLQKSLQLLHNWRDAHESRNHMSVSTFFSCCFFAIQAFLTGPGANGSTSSESSAFSAAWCARWGVYDPLLLLVCSLVLGPPILANLLSGWRQSCPKWPCLW